jgi:hypothetical protein
MQSFKECSNASTRIPRERVGFGGGSRKRAVSVSFLPAILTLALASARTFSRKAITSGRSSPFVRRPFLPASRLRSIETNRSSTSDALDAIRQAEEVENGRLENQAPENGHGRPHALQQVTQPKSPS